MLPEGYRWDSTFALGPESQALTERLWPNYLTAESDLPEPGLSATISRAELARRFPAWGIRRGPDLVAYAYGAHVLVAGELPGEGWAFAIRSALQSSTTNSFCLLAANVDPRARGQGLAQALIEKAKAHAAANYASMIAPVRPTHKHLHPEMPLDEYLRHSDPWLGLHRSCGGEVVGICARSVQIRASRRLWEEWLGQRLPEGDHVLPGGLAPLNMRGEVGVYLEPNVWVRYHLK